MMKNEGDVRDWVTKEFGERVFWIEQSSGSTVGFPDCLIAVGRNILVPLELKYDASLGSADNIELDAGHAMWAPKIRANQVACMRRLRGRAILSLVVVGSEFGVYVCTSGMAEDAILADCRCAMVKVTGDKSLISFFKVFA